MKSYGVLDAPGTGRLREILEDASGISKRDDCTIYVGEDVDGRIIATPNEADWEMFRNNCCLENPHRDERELHIAACSVYDGKFFDRAGYKTYTIDEILPRVHDLFAHGVIRYDSLWFLSEGEQQLMDAIGDAEKLVAKYGMPFILGENRDDTIMIAPLIREPEFLTPLSCMIDGNGAWRLSSIRPEMYPLARSGARREPYPVWHVDACYELYVGMAYREKSYGEFAAGSACVASLERAFEDAAKLAEFHKEPFEVLCNGTIHMKSGRNVARHATGSPDSSIRVGPDEFMDGGTLSPDWIAAAARGAYDKFLPMYGEFMAKDA